jgi:hypothetical protein
VEIRIEDPVRDRPGVDRTLPAANNQDDDGDLGVVERREGGKPGVAFLVLAVDWLEIV